VTVIQSSPKLTPSSFGNAPAGTSDASVFTTGRGNLADVPPTSATPAPEDARHVVNGAGRGQSSAPPPPSGAPTAVPGNAARFPGTATPSGDAA
jgi:hypothetical protein